MKLSELKNAALMNREIQDMTEFRKDLVLFNKFDSKQHLVYLNSREENEASKYSAKQQPSVQEPGNQD